jgi:hypothetical protein
MLAKLGPGSRRRPERYFVRTAVVRRYVITETIAARRRCCQSLASHVNISILFSVVAPICSSANYEIVLVLCEHSTGLEASELDLLYRRRLPHGSAGCSQRSEICAFSSRRRSDLHSYKLQAGLDRGEAGVSKSRVLHAKVICVFIRNVTVWGCFSLFLPYVDMDSRRN